MTRKGDKPHFSMLREFHLADLFTLANGACGVVAIFIAIGVAAGAAPASIYFSAGLIPVALVFDFLDGRIARSRHEASPLGRELDSLGDLLSFGVAPAVVAHVCGLNTLTDQFILVFFVLCGLSRLARYNVTAAALGDANIKISHFEGTPIPTSVVPLGVVVAAHAFDAIGLWRAGPFALHCPALLFALSGCLMVSRTVKIPKP